MMMTTLPFTRGRLDPGATLAMGGRDGWGGRSCLPMASMRWWAESSGIVSELEPWATVLY